MNVEEKLIDSFYKKLARDAKYRKALTFEQIIKFSKIIGDHKQVKYFHKIKNPLEIVLNFYEEIFPDFYKIIIEGINNNRIILNSDGSYVDTRDYTCHILFNNNDADVFMIAHEFGHYIALNSNPPIVPASYLVFSEVLSIYMEKRMEEYLINKYGLNVLVMARRKNRLYFEGNMLKIAILEFKYEKLYLSGKLGLTDLDINNILRITRISSDNTINFLLTYPLGNLISNYLIDKKIKIDSDLISILKSINFDELLEAYADNYEQIDTKKSNKKGLPSFFN